MFMLSRLNRPRPIFTKSEFMCVHYVLRNYIITSILSTYTDINLYTLPQTED